MAYRRRRKSRIRFLGLIIVLALAAVLFRSRICVVKHIAVYGNQTRSAEQVIALSGIQYGDNIFAVEFSDVARAMEKDPYMELLSVERVSLNALRLDVRERQARAALQVAGVIILVNEEGHILERLNYLPDGNILLVTGTTPRENAYGNGLEMSVPGQKRAFERALAEIWAQGLETTLSELNLQDLNNLYVVSRTGVQVLLGDDQNLASKLVWAGAVLEKLSQEGTTGGVLDVSTGKNAVYSAE